MVEKERSHVIAALQNLKMKSDVDVAYYLAIDIANDERQIE